MFANIWPIKWRPMRWIGRVSWRSMRWIGRVVCVEENGNCVPRFCRKSCSYANTRRTPYRSTLLNAYGIPCRLKSLGGSENDLHKIISALGPVRHNLRWRVRLQYIVCANNELSETVKFFNNPMLKLITKQVF